MIVTPATSWVSHRYTFGWLVELRRCCSTGPACHGQLEYTKHITLYLHWYCVYLHTFYICTYPHMHMGICIYIILCTCHISMLYRYVGMCDKHERSIHMLSCCTSQRTALFVPMLFVGKLIGLHPNTLAILPCREATTFSETTVIICHRPWCTSLALVCGWKAKAPQPTDNWFGHAISQFTSDFSHQSVMGMPWRNKRSDLRHVGRLESVCGVIWCHKAW